MHALVGNYYLCGTMIYCTERYKQRMILACTCTSGYWECIDTKSLKSLTLLSAG